MDAGYCLGVGFRDGGPCWPWLGRITFGSQHKRRPCSTKCVRARSPKTYVFLQGKMPAFCLGLRPFGQSRGLTFTYFDKPKVRLSRRRILTITNGVVMRSMTSLVVQTSKGACHKPASQPTTILEQQRQRRPAFNWGFHKGLLDPDCSDW